MIKLQTSRLILRDYKTEDFEEYFELISDKTVMYYLQDIYLETRSEAEKSFNHIMQDMQNENRRLYFLRMEDKNTGEQIGSIGYTVTDFTPVGKLAGLGYFTFQKFWGKGLVSEALERVMEFAFCENGVYRISTGCLKENKGSERVMQKCGMIKEAEHVDWEWHDGRMKTRMEYRMLKSDWEKSRI